jgi:hypothetical protein
MVINYLRTLQGGKGAATTEAAAADSTESAK